MTTTDREFEILQAVYREEFSIVGSNYIMESDEGEEDVTNEVIGLLDTCYLKVVAEGRSMFVDLTDEGLSEIGR